MQMALRLAGLGTHQLGRFSGEADDLVGRTHSVYVQEQL